MHVARVCLDPAIGWYGANYSYSFRFGSTRSARWAQDPGLTTNNGSPVSGRPFVFWNVIRVRAESVRDCVLVSYCILYCAWLGTFGVHGHVLRDVCFFFVCSCPVLVVCARICVLAAFVRPRICECKAISACVCMVTRPHTLCRFVLDIVGVCVCVCACWRDRGFQSG